MTKLLKENNISDFPSETIQDIKILADYVIDLLTTTEKDEYKILERFFTKIQWFLVQESNLLRDIETEEHSTEIWYHIQQVTSNLSNLIYKEIRPGYLHGTSRGVIIIYQYLLSSAHYLMDIVKNLKLPNTKEKTEEFAKNLLELANVIRGIMVMTTKDFHQNHQQYLKLNGKRDFPFFVHKFI